MASSDTTSSDPYLNPATGLLFNRVGATTARELSAAEADLVYTRYATLAFHPVPPTGDLAELQAIHHHLFQDVYSWAGQLRTVDIRKAGESDWFMPAALIQRGAGYATDELRRDNYLRQLPRDQFVARLAHHYDQFNHVHPFREGNGRTQRLFWDRITRDAGWQLDWQRVHGSVNDRACRAADVDQDLGPLVAMFDQITTARSHQVIAGSPADAARLAFPFDPRAIAETPKPAAPRRRQNPAPRGYTGPER